MKKEDSMMPVTEKKCFYFRLLLFFPGQSTPSQLFLLHYTWQHLGGRVPKCRSIVSGYTNSLFTLLYYILSLVSSYSWLNVCVNVNSPRGCIACHFTSSAAMWTYMGLCVLGNPPVNFPNAIVWVFPHNISLYFSILYSSVGRINIIQPLYRTTRITNANNE